MFKAFVSLVLALVSSLALASSLPRNYEFLSASAKADLLWQRVLEGRYPGALPQQWPGAFEIAAALNPTQLFGRPFSRVSDENPYPQRKSVHTYGAVARVEFVAEPTSGATGLLQGAQGLARLSSGADPADGLIPGMALKLLVDGQPSVNLHVMHSLTPQDTPQFFEMPFVNTVHIPLLGNFTLSLGRLLVLTQKGARVARPTSAREIFFYPTEEAQQAFSTVGDFRVALQNLPALTLYKVYLRDERDLGLYFVGRLNLTSSFVASRYGDETLFFKHEK